MSARCRQRITVILDRDGTVVRNRPYLDTPDGLQFCAGAAQGLLQLQDHGCRLLMITNQSGVARGKFTLDTLHAIHTQLVTMCAEAGIRLEAIYACPHGPDEGCDCRKPAVGLLRRAAHDFDFMPDRCIVIGDSACDIELGRNFGARTVWIRGRGTAALNTAAVPDFVADDLLQAARIICASFTGNSCHAKSSESRRS